MLSLTATVSPDPNTWTGQRDRVMFATLYNTGARVSELTGMRIMDFQLGTSPAVLIHGKGRKERAVPLWSNTAAQLRQWHRADPRAPNVPMFPNRSGTMLTRTSVTERLQLAAQSAASTAPRTRQATHHTARVAAFNRDAFATGRRRHHRDCAVAWAREHLNHPSVRRGRSGDERTRAQNHSGPAPYTPAIPATRPAPAIPTSTLRYCQVS